MIKNYLKIAWRNIARHKIHTAINVLGLCLGMTCCLFIFLWVRDERGVDNFHAKGKNLYAVYETVSASGQITNTYSTPVSYPANAATQYLMEDIRGAVPEVKNLSFYATGYELPWGHPETFQVGEKIIKLEGSRASAGFFSMFSYPLIEGDPKTALKEQGNIAISRKMAELFFGSPSQAMGQSMRYENSLNFVVTAVFENLTSQSSLKFDFLLSWEAHKKLLQSASNEFRTYLELSAGTDVKKVEQKINSFLQTRVPGQDGVKIQAGLQPYGDQYLHNIFVHGVPEGGRIEYVEIFSGVAIFILIIACINFMNLSTARSVKRAKEVGLRKVVGSSRWQLIYQFYGEALLFAFLALVLSVAFLYLLLPAFNQFTGKQISLPDTRVSFWVSLALLTASTGIVAGSYPALYLSSLRPVRILKGVMRFSQSAVWFRKGLTVFQFVLSIFLIIATLVISRQTSYVQNTHLGYDRNNLLYIRIEGELSKQPNYLLFKDRVSKMPGVAMVDRSSEAPHAMDFVVTDPVNWEGKQKNALVGFKPTSVGFDFVKLMNLKLAAGRDFSRDVATDSSDAFLVNEEAVRQMGMKNPIGKWVSAWDKKGHIIGVLKDFHTQSLREPILPIIIDVKEYEYFGVIIARTQEGKTTEALASLSKAYKEINPNYPFVFQFVDEEYKNLYKNEQIISKLSILFAVLAILISCLGLLGLVVFSAEQRIKEIGVRKVLGASLNQIITLFSKEFLKLILVAFLIAVPVGWYFMNQWLGDFAYRIALSWWIFALAGFSSLAIALLTVSYQAVKSGLANPVKSLRTE
jgi:putative ABC transport system permease protein